MAESSLTITYEELQREVANVLGFGLQNWDDDEYAMIDRYIQSGLRMFYSPAPLDGKTHQWSFMRPMGEISTTAPYSTGTIEIASGVVTLTGGTFPSWAAGGDIVVSSRVYAVDTRDSDTQVTLEDTTLTVASGATYELRRYAYDLPDDWGGLDSPITFQPGTNSLRMPIKRVDENEIRIDRQYDNITTWPRKFAVRVKTHDATVGTRYEILFHPSSDQAYHLEYRYKANPNDLSKTNKYHLGGFPHSETVKAACLAAVERESDEVNGPRQAYYMERLQASISIDRRENSAPFLGQNLDRSDYKSNYPYRNNNGIITTYNGVVPGS